MNIRNDEAVKELFVLDRIRNYRRIVSDSYSLLIANTRTLYVSVWPVCLVVGLFMSARLCFAHQQTLLAHLVDGLCVLIFLMSVAVMIHVVCHVLVDYSGKEVMSAYRYSRHGVKSLLREAFPTLLILVFDAVVSFGLLILGFFLISYSVAAVVVAALLIAFLQIPFSLALFRRAVKLQPVGTSLDYGFRHTFRYFGSTLFLLFVSVVLLMLLGVILCLPLEVLDLSVSQSYIAVASGDPTDLPSYINTLYYLLAVVLFSFSSYLVLIPVIPQILHAHSLWRMERK